MADRQAVLARCQRLTTTHHIPKETPMSVRQLFDLTGQVALVTGGSRGLGLQMAEALGEMGAKLAISARKADELAEAKAHLEGMGYEVLTVVNDLQKTEDIPGLVDQVIERFGTIDILVNNAGATWGAKAEDYPDAAWHKVMDLNVSAPFFLSREVGKRCMIPRGKGSIIVTARAASSSRHRWRASRAHRPA
jgi:gluconate 5-dehydrogenase